MSYVGFGLCAACWMALFIGCAALLYGATQRPHVGRDDAGSSDDGGDPDVGS